MKFDRSLAVFLCSCILASPVYAQLSITSPNNATVSSCADYATEVLNDPWDFSNPTDVPSAIKPLMYQQLSEPLSFSNGIFQFSSTGNDPYFSLLIPQVDGSIAEPAAIRYGSMFPIDVSRYNTLSFRMFTDQASGFQVYWSQPGTFAITDPVDTVAGAWRTYSIDLRSAGINQNGGGSYLWASANKGMFRFDPTFKSGANVLLDWMQLTKSESDCPQVSVGYNGSASNFSAIYIDDDTNLANGFHQSKLIENSGAAQTTNFSTARLFPGTYRVYGYESNEFGTLAGDPWDFSTSSDVDTSRVFNLNSTSFDGSRYCATTANTDGNFYLKFSGNQAIDASKFKYVYFKVDASAAQISLPNIVWENQSKGILGQAIATSFNANTGVAAFDMSANSAWTGNIYGLRIQPTKTQGVAFCVDWVSVNTTAQASPSQPALPTLVQAPGPVLVAAPSSLSLLQPDNQGGRDCPTHDLGNPWTMNNQADVQGLENISDAQFRPYNTVTDARGASRTGDFLRGISVNGSDDPKVHPVLFSNSINADRCVNLCYSLIINRSTEIYHSVARFTYLSTDGKPQDGDDIINPDRWSQSDVCLYLKELQQEPLLTPGTTHPWRGNINFMSVDPSEDREPTEFFLDYITIREDHKAKGQFAVVVEAPLSKRVELFSSTAKPALSGQMPSSTSAIGALSAGRGSNVFLWNTANVAEGRYYITARVDGVVRTSVLPVSVSQANAPDLTAPVHIIDSPTPGKRVAGSLQVAGAVIDDIRHAISEVFIDGAYVQGIVPSIYHKGAREQYTNISPDKPGFNVFVDIGQLANGTHTFELKSYDTSGNLTTFSTSFVKGATQLDADISYPDANAAPNPVTEISKTLTVQVAESKNLAFSALGYDGCGSTAILASKFSNMSEAVTLANGSGSMTKSAGDVFQWVVSSAPSALTQAQARKTPCPFKRVCAKKKGRKCLRYVRKRVCPKPTPIPAPERTAVPTASPATEDGVLYFQAKCNGSGASNIASIDFKGAISNPTRTTTFETQILQDLQSKLSS